MLGVYGAIGRTPGLCKREVGTCSSITRGGWVLCEKGIGGSWPLEAGPVERRHDVEDSLCVCVSKDCGHEDRQKTLGW